MNYDKTRSELELFAKLAKDWFSSPDRAFLQKYHGFFRAFFTRENLEHSDWEDLRQIGNHIHSFTSMPMARSQAFGKKMNYELQQYRDTFLRLALSSETVEEKYRWFLTSPDAARKYLGESSISEVFAQLNSDRYIMMNHRDIEAMRYLGIYPTLPRGLDAAAKFERLNEAARQVFPLYLEIVGSQTDLPVGQEVDQFFSWLYEHRIEDTSVEKPVLNPIKTDHRVWVFSPGLNADQMNMFVRDGDIGVDFHDWETIADLSHFTSMEEITNSLRKSKPEIPNPRNDSRCLWEFAKIMKEGDVVYAKKGRSEIVGYGVISGPYRYQPEVGFAHRRKIDWELVGNWEVPTGVVLPLKTLTDVSQNGELVKTLTSLVSNSVATPTSSGVYTLADAEMDLFLPKDNIKLIVERLSKKLNIILQGPPGVGKTYIARRLAWLLMEEKDNSRIGLVQFHQSMGYEDFVQGYRPKTDGLGFVRKDGAFLSFCQRAAADPGRKYVFIIDEINRGNMSKILGELLMLIEYDKRSPQYAVRLALHHDDDPAFHVPSNVYVIGLMNTADRSLALVDHALRRRFSFIEIPPAFSQPRLHDELEKVWEADPASEIAVRIGQLNRTICEDHDLGRGYQIGHSHFCETASESLLTWDDYRQVIQHDIGPLLQEYWFDRNSYADEQVAKLLEGIPE